MRDLVALAVGAFLLLFMGSSALPQPLDITPPWFRDLPAPPWVRQTPLASVDHRSASDARHERTSVQLTPTTSTQVRMQPALASVPVSSSAVAPRNCKQVHPETYEVGTIIISTCLRKLYFIDTTGALEYGVGVGRQGFSWSGKDVVSKKAEWPDWHPPAEMIARQPYLPRFVAGGPRNPLGARAIYIGKTMYRIHGTNEPNTIGQAVSSGCIRMKNDDVIDLYSRVKIGAKVVVL